MESTTRTKARTPHGLLAGHDHDPGLPVTWVIAVALVVVVAVLSLGAVAS